ncbi:hypothetical protein Tco_0543321 [Tanacetum coccineum]
MLSQICSRFRGSMHMTYVFKGTADQEFEQEDPRESFDELTDSTFDFSAFVLNRAKMFNSNTDCLAAVQHFELMKAIARADRLRFSDPLIQPEREGSTRDIHSSVEVLRFNTTAGNPVKKILLKLNLSDHRLFKMVVECQSVKVKEFQERCNIKAFQEWYEHVGPEVASPQDGKVTRWRRDCAWLMISRCSRSQCQIQVQGTSSIQEVNDHHNIFTRESQEYELKTKDKA